MIGKWHGEPFRDFKSKKWYITFEVDEAPTIFDKLKDKVLSIKVKEFKESRSDRQNRLLWECIGQIASELRTDKWDVYLKMLRRYGKFTYICVIPEAVEEIKKQWRECEELGEVNINGRKSVQLLCYFGSSTYDKKEFSVLMDGVISEMKEMGLTTPSERELEQVIESWGINTANQ